MNAMAMQGAGAIAKREVVRFLRQRSRIIGSLLTPLMAWLFFGVAMGGMVDGSRMGGVSYGAHFFPGAVLLSVLFVAIFASISLIEDRHEGFLQAVLVSPMPRWALVLGKVLGGTALATFHGALFLPLAPAAGISLTFSGIALALVVLAFASFAVSSVSFLAAWYLDSSQGFHSFMNAALMPAWLLSGAFFPETSVGPVLRAVMAVNPVAWAFRALEVALRTGEFSSVVLAGLAVCLGFGVVTLAVATRMTRLPKAA